MPPHGQASSPSQHLNQTRPTLTFLTLTKDHLFVLPCCQIHTHTLSMIDSRPVTDSICPPEAQG